MGTFTRGRATNEAGLSIITTATLCFLQDPFHRSFFRVSYDTTYLSWREFLVLFTQAPDRDLPVCVQSGVPGCPARENITVSACQIDP